MLSSVLELNNYTLKSNVFVIASDPIMRSELVSLVQSTETLSYAGDGGSIPKGFPAFTRVFPDILIFCSDLGAEDQTDLKTLSTRYPDLKILVYSTVADKGLALRALLAGATGYVCGKPTKPKLILALSIIATGALWLDPHVSELLQQVIAGKRPLTSHSQTPLLPGCHSLSKRELQILQLIGKSYSNPKISTILGISIHTTKTHVRNILAKLNVSDRIQAAVLGFHENVLDTITPDLMANNDTVAQTSA